jgi:hypothetical protein
MTATPTATAVIGGLATTEHGMPVDERFSRTVDPQRLHRTAQALRDRGYDVRVADDEETARAVVLDLIPDGAQVFTMSSVTLRELGLEQEINESSRFRPVRPQIYAMDFETQKDEIRKLGAGVDWTVGSVHAVTDDGRMVIASATGSQLALYSFGSGRVVYVIGAQKLVRDLDEAFERVEKWSWPQEDIRMRREHGQPSTVLKTLIVDGEAFPGRSTIVLVNAALGY